MKYLLPLLLFASCNSKPMKIEMKGQSGHGYLESCQSAMNAMYVCELPEEYPGSDEDGAAYREGQAVAEDADCIEDYEEGEEAHVMTSIQELLQIIESLICKTSND